MYFEARNHVSVAVHEPQEAVHMIHHGKIDVQQCPVWTHNGQRIALVDDSHIDERWREVAVINLDTRTQLETITFGWCKTEEEKLHHIIDSLAKNLIFRRNIVLPLDGDGTDALATFTCGCCGTGFESTIRAQRKYDQDAGYGICPPCDRRYYAPARNKTVPA